MQKQPGRFRKGIIRLLGGTVKSNQQSVSSGRVQTREEYSHPFHMFDDYVPLKVDYNLYKALREGIPILDTAVDRIVRLVGTFSIECDDEDDEDIINEFVENVKVNSHQKGMHHFVESYLDQLVEAGNSVGEIVLNNAKDDIYALRNVDIRSIRLKKTDNPLEHKVCQIQPNEMEPVELPYQDLIMFTPLDPEGDSPYGISLYRSMPFMADILVTIFGSMKPTWERFGTPRYSVVYKPNELISNNDAFERADRMKEEFESSMEKTKNGNVSDFIGVGDIQVSVIGADNEELDYEIPIKQLLEQIVSATGLPPFLLGLSWSTTERMSQQQADFLTSELDNYRDEIEPMITDVIDMWQNIKGHNIPYEVKWDDINLQDRVEEATAEMYKQRAREAEIDNVIKLRDQNIIDQDIAAEELGYEEPVGEAPEPFTWPEANQEGLEDEKGYIYRGHRIKKKDFKSMDEERSNDPIQVSIENEAVEDYQAAMDRFKDNVLEIIPSIDEEMSKDINGLPDDYQERLDRALDKYIKDMLGENAIPSKTNEYGIYGEHILHAFGYGLQRANETVRELFGRHDANIITPNYNHPAVQELMAGGMETVVTRAKEKKDDVLLIMRDHAAVGDNPLTWAATLEEKLSNSIDKDRWYWERIARSESAMAIDRAEMAEYEAEGFTHCEWSAAPDACEMCLALNGHMWELSDAPDVVMDTHPHCRCRKIPRTERQYEEWSA